LKLWDSVASTSFFPWPVGHRSCRGHTGKTDHALRLVREHSAPGVQVKAAGGVRTLDDLLRVRALGVTRIGATATREFLEDAKNRGFV
jgi:deoxyribose-phosphate aldolase